MKQEPREEVDLTAFEALGSSLELKEVVDGRIARSLFAASESPLTQGQEDV